MSRKANVTLIGGFVVGGIALAAIAIVVFGSGRFFQKRAEFVMYFTGSVYGLNIGAPVSFRGVKVGEVKKIFMHYNGRDMSIRIPVVVELGGTEVQAVNIQEQQLTGDPVVRTRKLIAALIEKGLRAQLGQQSFVTGQLLVILDFFPDKPAELVGAIADYPEIPTIPTTIQQISDTLKALPLEEVASRMIASLEGADRLINSPEIREGIENLNTLLQHSDNLVLKADKEMALLLADLGNTLKDAHKMIGKLNREIEPLSAEATSTLAEAKNAMTTATETLKKAANLALSLDGKTDGLNTVQYEFTTAMREFAAASASFRVFIDYFERNPEMLIRGKSAVSGGQ